MCLHVLCAGAVAGEGGVCVLERPPSADAKDLPPLHYWKEARSQPRPLEIHHLRADLCCPRYEAIAMVGDDPDGPGPAESQLEPPLALAARHKALAAVNTNAFGWPPGPPPKGHGGWSPGRPADIVGWAVTGGRQVSPPKAGYTSFWIDPKGAAHIGNLSAPREACEAVAGFGHLLVDGEASPREGGPLHPRTALGLDREARWLTLVVVDGRQRGTSEGMALRELAMLMKDLGCWNALNLDGGGSSILLAAVGQEGLRIMNRPADRGGEGRPAPRPIPVMLGIRERAR